MKNISSVDNEIYIIYIFSDFNIYLFLSDSYILEKKNILNSKYEFCIFSWIKAIIKVPTTKTTSSSTAIDHILASYPERVTQCGVIDIFV